MKITFILPPVNVSGGLRVIGIYASLLSKRGHEIVLVSPPHKRPRLIRRARNFLKKGWKHAQSDPGMYIDSSLDHRVLNEYRAPVDADVPDADVVIATWWETAKWVNNLSPNKGTKAYFMQEYGAEGQQLDKVAPTWHLPLHKITICQRLVDLIRAETGDDMPVDLVLNAVDFQLFSTPLREKQPIATAGFVYRQSHSKGADIVFDAYRKVLKEMPEFRLVGFGPDGIPEFSAPGFAYHQLPPEEKLAELYSSCDLWLFPSRIEGFGLPILEAMACRTPVVATPAGAAPDLVSERNGALLDSFEPDDMADAMLSIAEMSAEEWRTLSDQAYKTATGYTWDDATELFERSLMRILPG